MLRREAIILIWLREKMEVHLCTVSIRLAAQSSWNATLLKLRDATVTRLQNPVQYMLCSEHIIRNSIRKTNTRPVWRKEKMRIKNWFEKKSLWQTCLSTTCSRAKDSYAVSERYMEYGWIERLFGISMENELKKTGTCAKFEKMSVTNQMKTCSEWTCFSQKKKNRLWYILR